MKNELYTLLKQHLVLLDGATGTMVQTLGLSESDYRGREFLTWGCPLKGCMDLLCLTAPRTVAGIHRAYLEAGADIVTTNSFSANAISLQEYGLQDYAYRIARAAAEIARGEADAFSAPGRPRFVAGSMGPTSKTASMSASVGDSAARDVTFSCLESAYYDQARGLADGGVDVFLLETVFDTLNAKAAIFAIQRLQRESGRKIPMMISVTVSERGGRTLSGQSIEAFWCSVKHARPLSVGINCSFGAREMLPHLERLSKVADTFVSVHPNAGLPNISGGYDETPESFAAAMETIVSHGLANIIGGCCGTTPEFIAALTPLRDKYAPRPLPAMEKETAVCGLETLRIVPEVNFINIGERTNVAGSAKFARMIREGDFAGAIAVARNQVEAGAQIIDVCMDASLLDSAAAMRTFLNMAAGEVEISRVPVMIDSSDFATIEAGLQCCQGKSIVNSISLKEGEAEFLRRAALIRSYGAAAVVMLFDEKGQATDFPRKIEVAERCYNLLVRSGFPAEDIIFDPNILSVATGIAEHDNYALAFLQATRWIKEHLPHAKVSGGVSNLSFAFRGNNAVREAMHSSFLYHARLAGMDMGIVNPQMLKVYSEIEPELLEKVEDVILCRRADAAQRLADYASKMKEQVPQQASHESTWRSGLVQERIRYAMMRGISDFIETDCLEALQAMGSPIAVIDKVMMPAMESVGTLFGEGKMFLPQVVKTASVMKRGVAALEPYIGAGSTESAGRGAAKVVIATVKGDIHDIGKNIVSVVMACNGCEIIDLGVMVEPERIVEAVQRENAGFVCLSGLITPSLEQMIGVCRALREAGITIPVIVGGATTSPMHTAVKMAPEYDGLVVQSSDASRNVQIISALNGPAAKVFAAGERARQRQLRELYRAGSDRRKLHPYGERLAAAIAERPQSPASPAYECGIRYFDHYSVSRAAQKINWDWFYAEWGVKDEASRRELHADALQMLSRLETVLDLQGAVGRFPVEVHGDDIIVQGVCLPMLRCQIDGEENLSVADFAAAAGDVELFAISAGTGLKPFCEQLRGEGDLYGAFMAKVVADRLCEALADEFVPAAEGERHAFGYPSCPDHSLKEPVFNLLEVPSHCDMHLTGSYMIDPAESLCGINIAGARYFAVGRISQEQLQSYAQRRGLDADTVSTLIPKNL